MKQYQLLLAHIHQFQSALFQSKKKGGATIIISVLLLTTIILPFGMFILERTEVEQTKKYIERRIVVSALAGLYNIDEDSMAYGDLNLSPVDAENTFLSYFKMNMNLDDSFTPINPNVAYGQITIKELIVYTNDMIPGQCPLGGVVNYPAIHVIAETEVDRMFFKSLLGDKIKIAIHQDVDIYTKY